MSSLLAASGAAPPSRSSSAVVAKPARGFHVFRIDGYSVTTTLPAGERITSEPFYVGGRSWLIDYYPNGTDASADSTDSDAIAVYLRLHGTHVKQRVRAEYKFGLLDLAGAAAYELPVETGVFSCPGGVYGSNDGTAAGDPGRGYAAFITKEDLGRRRESLLKEDSLAIFCDVAVAEVGPLAVATLVQMHGARMARGRRMVGRWGGATGRRRVYDYTGRGYDYYIITLLSRRMSIYVYDGSHDGGGKRAQQPPDDMALLKKHL
ncbi:unnamed protein product [Urochloa decumbens]|uniref:MATH domain-containing protein n=1 Tax=Urochloa decumbens TaxID=240449 RepID=A0ABC9B8N8_9POAL